jgi:ABC-type sugar transport system permease subunit
MVGRTFPLTFADKIMDTWSVIIDLIGKFGGWRTVVVFIPTVLAALLFHFVIGWGPVTTSVAIVMVLISAITGIVWQLASEGRFRK